MKAPKIIAAVASFSAVLALTIGGLAYANPIDPALAPMPEKAQSTSIAKQVTAIIVYQDQEEAEAMATEIQEIHDEIALDTLSTRANLAYKHSAAGEKAAAEEAATEVEEAVAEEPTSETVEAADPIAAVEATSEAAATMEPRTIDVNGDVMGYIDSFETASAPSTGAGLWMGSDSTTDGSWGYFIGHNPGSFTRVMTLKNGDPVTVCDSDGNTRTYHVVDEFIVPDDTYWEDIQSRVIQYGESIIVQTCCGDNAHYRVVIAD